MSSVGPLITCRFCNSFSALTHAEVNAHRIREQCDVAFLARFESGSDSAPSPNGSVQDDQMSLGGVSISSNQIGSIESHQDMDIDNNSGNSISEGMITVIYMRIKNDINQLTTLDNDDEEEDNGYGPIMYEHVTSDEQISHVDSLAIGLYKLCDQHKVTRQFKRDLSNYLNKKLISKLGEEKIDGKFTKKKKKKRKKNY